jgi:very-short-patch-repair endonuclease
MPTLDDLLLPVFLAQHGLVSRRDVLRLGGSPHHIDTRLNRGRWERAETGVYRLAGFPVDWRAELLAPILSVDAPAVASHCSAAVLHGIPGFGRGTPELTVPRGTKLRRRGVRVHTSTDLERTRPTSIDGIPVTHLRRTLLDLARIVGDQRLLRTIEWGRRERAITWAGLIATLALHARRGRPGIARLRRVILANVDRDQITDSDLELIALAVIREHGLPEPVLHHRVLDGDRFVAEVDLAYPHLRIAIELDGAVHLDRHVRERDLPRQNDLVLLGWTVLRFTWERLQTRPDRVVAEIAAAIRSAERRVAG